MRNPFSSLQLGRIFTKKNFAIGIPIALALFFIGATIYYYVQTSEDTVIVDTTAFPAGFPSVFTADYLTDHVAAQLQQMIAIADSGGDVKESKPQGPGPRSIKEQTLPTTALSNLSSPIFDLKWRGISLNLCRRIGMHAKAKRFLELGVIGLPDKGWRLTALTKQGLNFESSGSAPRAGGACTDFEGCAEDLAQQILEHLDTPRLLRYCIKINTPESNRLVVELYKKVPAASLKADDFVAWGNAYHELGKFDEALQRYQEALKKDPNSCSARVARGFVYFKRAHGTQLLPDLKYAERDFRDGLACNPKNAFTLNSLCHTLLRQWVNSPNREPGQLVEAKTNCEEALTINPEFTIADVNIGYILYRQEKHAEALRQLENLSQRHPTDSNLFLNYGFLLYLEYRSTLTKETLRQATTQTRKSWELDHTSHAAMNNLGFFYYEDGNYIQAVEFWEKANTPSLDDPDSVAGWALGAYKLGDTVSAITLLTRAIQIDSNFRDPRNVKEKHYWSDQAASDLVKLLRLLPSANRQSTTADKSRSGASGRTL